MRHVALLLLLLLASVRPVPACFGPKLHVGSDGSPLQQVLTALVAVYLVEKTGTETELVPLPPGSAARALAEERVDLVFAPEVVPGSEAVFAVGSLPQLLSGPRPLQDLQFTLVRPALGKLERQLTPQQVATLVASVEEGSPPMATARRFLQEQGWI